VLVVFLGVLGMFLWYGVVRAQAEIGMYLVSTSTVERIGLSATQYESVTFEQREAILRELKESNKLLNYIARKI